MAPVRVRRLTEQEGQRLQRIVRRGSTSSVRFRRAMMLLASSGGSPVPAIAQLVQADEDTVRDVIHRFNEMGLACLDPRWAGGRPRLLSIEDENFVVETATIRPTALGKPFTRWSIRKLADYPQRNIARTVRIGQEALHCLLIRRGISFQRTKTWKESPDPDFDTKLDRIEFALTERPDRTFALDEFGPLGIRPTAGSCSEGEPGTAAGDLPPHPRHHLLPRLLLGRRRSAVGRGPPAQGHRPHVGCPTVDPRGPPGRRPDLRDPRQPVRAPELADPPLGRPEQGRALLHPDLRVLGQPDRGSLRPPAAVHPRQFEPPQPHRPDSGPARLPALAQPERPPPRRPRRPTTRARTDPQRETHPLGRQNSPACGLNPEDLLVTALVVELEACRLGTGNDLANCAGIRDHRLKGSLELREVTQAPERTEHATLAVVIEALSEIRPGELHKALPEVPIRLVSGGNYCSIGGQVTGSERQRVFAVNVMQGESHGAIFPCPVPSRPGQSNRLAAPTRRTFLVTALALLTTVAGSRTLGGDSGRPACGNRG